MHEYIVKKDKKLKAVNVQLPPINDYTKVRVCILQTQGWAFLTTPEEPFFTFKHVVPYIAA